jgi:hypothetical protein
MQLARLRATEHGARRVYLSNNVDPEDVRSWCKVMSDGYVPTYADFDETGICIEIPREVPDVYVEAVRIFFASRDDSEYFSQLSPHALL